jgi:hypothetical protein
VVGATPFPKVGWSDHPIFGQGVASATPYRPYGGGRSYPRPLGVVRPPQKAQKKKKKKGKNGFWPLGVAGPPPRAWRWPKPPPTAGRGCPKPPPGPRGWSGHPQRPKPIFPLFSFFFFLGLLGWPDHPQRPGVASATPIRPVWGGRSHPLAKNGVVRPPHFWEGGGSNHPDSLFSFIFLFFIISFFFPKKKKPKMQNYAVLPKTASFWTSPKRRSFGVEGIMGIYKYLYIHYTLEGS